MKSPVVSPGNPAWPHVANIFIGLWLLGSVPALGVTTPAVRWSDTVSGVAVILFSALAIRHAWAAWVACVVGLWVMISPLVFWASNAAVYNNDLLAGAMMVSFAVIIPRLGEDGPGSGAPPGWSYNPSAWSQRLGIVFLAMVGFFLSRYMAAFQLEHIAYPWDPFFGDGTRRVLNSDVSKAFPVSDAGLGALSYLIDALAGLVGGRRRWRTMPWMVMLFGFFIIPPGVVSIVLVILQPVSVGAWCTLCLAASVVMLLMVPPALDEVIATIQFLSRVRRDGGNVWRAFWFGEGSDTEESQLVRKRSEIGEFISGFEVFSAPWNLLLSALVGAFLMSVPSVFGLDNGLADHMHIVGALVVTFAVVSFAEPARLIRFLNVLCGVWVLLAPWFLEGETPIWRWIAVVTGFVVIALSVRRGRVEDHYGRWQRFIV